MYLSEEAQTIDGLLKGILVGKGDRKFMFTYTANLSATNNWLKLRGMGIHMYVTCNSLRVNIRHASPVMRPHATPRIASVDVNLEGTPK